VTVSQRHPGLFLLLLLLLLLLLPPPQCPRGCFQLESPNAFGQRPFSVDGPLLHVAKSPFPDGLAFGRLRLPDATMLVDGAQ
jgi:hypothetical protein